MKISASRLYHKVIILKVTTSKASAMAQTLLKFHFSLANFFGKNRTSISNAPQYSSLCLVIRQQYHFDTINHFSIISYPSIPRHPLVFQKNECLNFWKHSSIGVLEKNSHLKYFCQLPSKTSKLESFLSTLGGFSKSSSEQLFSTEPVCTCFCKKAFHSTRYLRNFQEF